MSEIERFSMRIGDLELKTCDEYLISIKEHTSANIVKWQTYKDGKPYCFTVAAWRLGDEGFELHFVGRRPFDYCSSVDFWELATVGQRRLDEYFDSLEDYGDWQ